MIIWTREVTEAFNRDQNGQQILVKRIISLFNSFIEVDLKRYIVNTSKSSNNEILKIIETKEEKKYIIQNCIDLERFSSIESFSTTGSLNHTDSFQSTKIVSEPNTFEFQSKYFVEK